MRFFLLLLMFCGALIAKQWDMKDFYFVIENDADWRTDRDYTYGSEIGALFVYEKNSYVSFSFAHQMFTPNDFDEEDKDFSKERPYAGYMYAGAGYHVVRGDTLDSFNLQLGIVGPSAKMEQVQKFIHSLIGAHEPLGWDKQIRDEPILQLNYERRDYTPIRPWLGNRSSLVRYAGANLGNASVKGVTGVYYRVGWNTPKDFAPRRIDYRGYPNLPISDTHLKQKYALTLGVWMETSVVLRDIFLDGNTLKDSVSVEKNIIVAKGGFSASCRYKRFSIDYLRTFSTKEFKTQSYYHHYGSLYFSYRF